MADILLDTQAASATPASGKAAVYVDATLKVVSSINDAGVVTNYGPAVTATAHGVMVGAGTTTPGVVGPNASTGVPMVSKGSSADPAFDPVDVLLTTPKITTGLKDANGNTAMTLPATASAVNYVANSNAATGNAPQLAAAGSDTDVDLKLSAKGAGGLHIQSGAYGDIQPYTPIAGGTVTLDLSKGNIHHITMPAGNVTVAVSSGKIGQLFLVRFLQDNVGSRTATWFTTIKWAGGSAPTLTTTANKADTIGFEITGSNTYDGGVVFADL